MAHPFNDDRSISNVNNIPYSISFFIWFIFILLFFIYTSIISILINSIERENPGLLHAKLGEYLAETKYKITDPDILHSIKVHTTGEPAMNVLDKIIYIADYIEPRRDQAPRLEYIRKIAFEDLDLCVSEILHDTLHFLNNRKGSIDPVTQKTFDYYQSCRK